MAHPPKRGRVRAETYASGYVIRKTESGCSLFLVAQNDIKGMLPKFIVNSQAARVPPQWIGGLQKACLNSPIGEEEMVAWSAPFRKRNSPISSPHVGSSGSRRRGRSPSPRHSLESNRDEPEAFVPFFHRYHTPRGSEVDQLSEPNWPQE
jgi:hypothetical protein